MKWSAASLIVAVAMFAGPAARLRAEVLLLKTGGRIEGELLNSNRKAADAYRVKLTTGLELSLAADQVQRMVVKSDVQRQYEQLLPKMTPDVDGHWKMAEWCREAGLTSARKEHLSAIIKLDPDHEKARAGLNYARHGSQWLTAEEYLSSQGYVRTPDGWKLRQQVEIESRARQNELAVKDYRRHIRTWMEQLSNPRRGEAALANLHELRDPLAAPALIEVLANRNMSLPARLLCLDLLQRMPPGMADGVMVELALNEPNANLRDRCLDELKRSGSRLAINRFTRDLKSKDNTVVNRAALCLQRMGDPETTRDLIDALVTSHKFLVTQGQAPGSMATSLGGGGSGNDGGMGGLSMGGKAQLIRTDLKNEMALAALTAINPGINFGFDEAAWKRWYSDAHTTTDANLRRDF